MANLPHAVPSRLSHLTAALYGREDDTLIAWQRACAQAAETRRGQHDEERLRKALTLAQDGHVELGAAGAAVVTSGQTPYHVQADVSCTCPDFARRRVTCKHLLAVQLHQDALALLWVPEEPLKAPLPGAEPPRAWMPPPAPSAPTARAAAAWDVHEAQTSACVRVRIGDLDVTYTIRGTSDDDVIDRLDATLERLRDTCEVHELRAAERAKARAAALVQAQQAPALSPEDLHTLLQQTVLQALAAQNNGAAANGHANGHTPMSPPRCPAHGDMRESTKQPGTWFCTQKLPNGKYCPSKA
jgi:hypothetical protein